MSKPSFSLLSFFGRSNVLPLLVFLLVGAQSASAENLGKAPVGTSSGFPAAAGDAVREEVELLPRTIVPENVFDFGTIKAGLPAEHRFPVQNTGQGPLRILKLHNACGCTTAVLDSDTVLPGATTYVKVTFDTTGFQGPKMKTVRLYTNDPKQGSFALTMQGTIQPDVQVSVLRLRFGDVVRGQIPQLEFTATVDPASPVKIVDAVTRSPFLDVHSEDVTVDNRPGKRVKVMIKPDVPIGVFRERVSLKTSSAETPVVNVPVLAIIQGDLVVEPNIISYGVVDGPLQNPIYKDAQIRSQSSHPLRVLSIESDTSSISGKAVEDGGKTKIRVTVGTDIEGPFRARLTLTTDSADAEQHQIILPVFGIVTKPGDTLRPSGARPVPKDASGKDVAASNDSHSK